ncbi:MAG: hypothetical protein U5R31_09790 [Acidimicrobiia bacterium]|nr:hypothetical protein [Acidimicrobiia bacterium]
MTGGLREEGSRTAARLQRLDQLVDFRNAIGHGDEVSIAAMQSTGAIRATITSYVRNRRSLNALAATMDQVVATRVGGVLDCPPPW